MFTSDQRKGILFYCFLSRTASRLFFVDVNLTQSFSQKTGMARHAI
jgi:hypothetical protein